MLLISQSHCLGSSEGQSNREEQDSFYPNHAQTL